MLSVKERLLIPLIYLFALLPPLAARRFAKKLVIFLKDKTSLLDKHWRMCNEMIERCMPELTEQQRRQLAEESLIYTAKHYISTPALWVRSPQWAKTQFNSVEGLSDVEQALESNAVIVLFLHYGSWEAQCIHLTDTFSPERSPVTILVKDNMKFGNLVNKMRVAARPHGIIQPANAAGVRAVFKALKRRQLVTFSPDHVPGKDNGAVVAPFFGNPSQTMTLVHQLVQKTAVKVFIGVSVLDDDNSGYHVKYAEVDSDVYAVDELTSVTALNRSIEKIIVQNPKEYMWWYKRFRGL